MNKDVFFFLLAMLGLIDFTNYVFLVPILPDFLLKKGISLTLIGVILSVYQVSNIMASLFLAKRLLHYSKARVIIFGQGLLVFSNIAMSFLDYMSTIDLILSMAILFRLIQGVSLACVASTTYSYVSLLYQRNLDQKFALMEIGTGIGLSLGPVIGGILYQYLNFTWAFLTMSFVYFAMGVLIFPSLKQAEKEIWKKHVEHKEEDQEEETKKQTALLKVAKDKNFLLTTAFFVISLMSYSIIQPGFSDHIHSYGESDQVVGLIFGLGDLV